MADSSRRLPARTVGLLSGQETLTVPSLEAKLAAQLAGLGVGYLPDHVAAPYLASGQLVTRLPEEGNPREPVFLVWRSGHKGRALAWFRERLLTEALSAQLMLRQALSGANQRG
jgi:DNA-binding transcriptional LysR family regulator